MINLDRVSVAHRLTDTSLHIAAGSSCHIVGENGAGKSTLLKVCAGLLSVDTGTCSLNDQGIDTMPAGRIASIRGFHEQGHSTAFDVPAGEYIGFYTDAKAIDNRLINALDIAHLLNRPVSQLSGGEQQRINLVRCIAQVWSAVETGTALLCLDEPLQGLDVRHQQGLLLFLRGLCRAGNTVLMTSHDINISARFADNVLMLRNGACIAQGNVESTFTPALLRQCFGIDFVIINNQNALQIQPQWPST